MEITKYRFNKVIYLTTLFFQNLLVKFFYKNNINSDLQNIINSNRAFLDSIDKFLSYNDYKLNDYGLQKRIYDQIDNKISGQPIYSDLIIFLINNILLKKNINYLEIGTSVLKNFLQINNGIQNSNLIAYDINEINPTFRDLEMFSKNNNNLKYFKGSVLSKKDTQQFKEEFPNKFDFIFSDAMHTAEGIRSEYELIIKNHLANNFIIYYDDLDFLGLEEEFSEIKFDISESRNQHIYSYTFFIHGWIGQYEKLHKNGIISNLNIEEFMNKENLKIYKFKKMT